MSIIYHDPRYKDINPSLSDWTDNLGVVGAVISGYDTLNDINYNMQSPLHEDVVFDEASRGTAQDRHVVNQLYDFFATGNGLWGKSSSERELEEGVKHATTIANDLGSTFNNTNSVTGLQNTYNANAAPELLTSLNPTEDNGRSAAAAAAINPILLEGQKNYITGFYDQVNKVNQKQLRQNMMNYFAEGGMLNEFNTGGSHEENPLGGIPQGIASDGLDNLVEEGEIRSDFEKDSPKIFSDKKELSFTKDICKEFNLPDYAVGMTPAGFIKKVKKEYEDRVNDPISINTMKEWDNRAFNAQEIIKKRKEEKKVINAIKSMSDEEKAALMSSLAQPMAQQEGIDLSQPMYAKGGKIYIKPENRGKFTALKKRTGKSASWFKAHGTPAQKKMATFALNAKKWSHKHDLGGINDVVFKDLVPPDLSRSFAQYILPIDQTYTQYLPQVLTGNAINTAPGFGGINHSTTFAGEDINDTINIPKPVTESNDNKGTVITRRLGESLRYAPAIGAQLGAITAALQPKDYTLANRLEDLASEFRPMSAPHIGGYRRYTPYDVNLGDAENLALTAAALSANRGQNRATQGALNTAVLTKAQEASAKRNLAAQQANEANRLATDTYNLGIDQFNAQRDSAYDQLNQQILANRINMLGQAAQARDASRTAWANNINTTAENAFNQLGNVGRDNWNRNQRDILLNALGREGLLELIKLGYFRG